MRVIYKKLPFRRPSCLATIGVFDGIHRGHQYILSKCSSRAAQVKLKSLAITFDLAPQQFLQKKQRHNAWPSTKTFAGVICDSQQKVELIRPLGLNYLWFLKASQNLLELKPDAFLRYIFNYFSIKELMVGEDFRFGYAGSGNVDYLQKSAAKFGFKLNVIGKKKFNKEVISSTLIRRQIREAKLDKVKLFLGRNYSLKGKVVKGRGIGKILKFPTANVLAGDYVVPQRGVYAAEAILGKRKYLAAVNIGRSPTLTAKRKCVIEAHIIKFKRNILGKNIEIVFIKRLRDEQKFPNSAILSSAIKRDVKYITAKYSSPA